MKIFLNFNKRKHLVKQGLMMLQLEMWKNELILHEGFEDFCKDRSIEVPPNFGSADILIKTVKCVDKDLYNKISNMPVKQGLVEIMSVYGLDTTEEDENEFKSGVKSRTHTPAVKVPKNADEIASKISKGEPITAEDMQRPDDLLNTKKAVGKADMKVVKDNILEQPRTVKPDGTDLDKGSKIIV